ncbi:hypothetical protein CUJ84_Chr003641 [Rhizobium leguminosarum]|uniref:Uncharacterized protein n=1 Tax=Rhizobium leguminosarum TaxID=384 RepID=A0A2K9Z6V8_RHILE|nr:hypothetical protein CUJ84_Chr003641 [Rhizobium leguminosarum]
MLVGRSAALYSTLIYGISRRRGDARLLVARSLTMVASNDDAVFQFGPDHDRLLAPGGGAWFLGTANPVLTWSFWRF